jgi:hypothetical protein
MRLSLTKYRSCVCVCGNVARARTPFPRAKPKAREPLCLCRVTRDSTPLESAPSHARHDGSTPRTTPTATPTTACRGSPGGASSASSSPAAAAWRRRRHRHRQHRRHPDHRLAPPFSHRNRRHPPSRSWGPSPVPPRRTLSRVRLATSSRRPQIARETGPPCLPYAYGRQDRL